MNTYRELAKPYLEEVFKILDECCTECDISYFLIGAQARDIHILEGGLKPIRVTLDIDFAIMVPEMEIFENLRDLLEHKGFKKVNMPHRMIHIESGTIIDLLPFGEVEQERTVNFDERNVELSVIGLQEVKEKTVEYSLDTVSFQVSPLEGIFILKLISNSEKPDRIKDLDDICHIIESYYEINVDRIYADAWHIIDNIDEKDFMLMAGAKLLGFDARKILSLSEELKELIVSIIDKELQSNPGSISAYYLSKESFDSFETIQNIFKHIKDGINT